MATVTLKEARIDTANLHRKEDGHYEISGQYSLISTADKVLATQQYGKGYQSLDVPMSPATSRAFDAFVASFKGDLNTLLGFTEGAQ
jgi:hypothetical protein